MESTTLAGPSPSTSSHTYTLPQIDQMIRTPTVQRKDIAARLGTTPTGLYAALEEEGVRVATLSFLVNKKTGEPLSPITPEDIAAAGRYAINRGRLPSIASTSAA